MSHCKHARVSGGEHHGFVGSVAQHPHTEENQAAHGCVSYTEECLECGARRSVNQNQWHYEYGVWGPSREERRARASKVTREARARVAGLAPLVFEQSGRRAVVQLDADGLLSIEGAEWSEILPSLSRTAWLEKAKAARHALRDAELARGEI